MFDNEDYDALLARLRVDKSPAGRSIMSYEDGGPVEGGGLTDEQLDQLAAQDHGDTGGGGLTDEQLDQLAAQHEGPQAEGVLATGAREAAHAVVPTAAAVPAGMAGFELGAAAGAPLAPLTYGLSIPIGGFLGAAGLAGGASYLTGKAQEAALDATGLNDTEQRQANREANPNAADIGALVPQAAAMKFTAAPIVERVLMGGVNAAMTAGTQAASGEDLDPKQIAEAAVLGAAMPRFNRAGEALAAPGRYAGRWRPGRPDTQPTPTSDQAKAEAAQSEPPKTARGAAVSQPPPATDNPTTGNPQSAPTRSSREYPKDAANPNDTGKDFSSGYMDPDVQTAMEALGGGEQTPPAGSVQEEQPQAAPAQPAPPAPAPVTAHPESFAEPQPARVDENPVTDAFRAAGQPVPGEKPNRPQPGPEPVETRPQPDEEIKAPNLVTDTQPRIKPDNTHSRIDEAAAATHPEPSEAQAKAGNYEKGHVSGADVGLPGYRISTETERGGVRKGPGWEVEDFPYHYGHVLGTTGADGDPMDIAIDNTGKKKFIVDQLDADTGKFDEHKIFANVSDEARVKDLYTRGFTDGRGPDRLGAVTEVDTDGLKDFLKNGDETKPFNPTAEQKSRAIEPVRAVVQNALDALGKMDSDTARAVIERIKGMSGDEQAMAATKALKALQLRDGNAVQGEYASARTPSERPKIEGTNITARSKADAERKLDAIKAHQEVMDAYPPGHNSEVGMDKQSLQAMHERVTAAVTELDKRLAGNGYKPSEKTAPFLWAKAARSLAKMKNITPKRAAEFIATEKQLRAGTAEDVANVRDVGKIEGNIARSRRSGDEAVANAEADAASKSPFEVPHEEAEAFTEPTAVRDASELPPENARQLDTSNPEDAAEAAKILNEGMPQWKRDQEAREAADRAKTEKLKAARIAAKGETKVDLAQAEHEEDLSRPKNLVEKFRDDERGAVNLSKVLKDVGLERDKATGLLNSAAKMGRARASEPKRFYARGPSSPQEEYARSMSDDLFKLHQADVQHKEDLTQIATAAPKGASDEAIFHARDSGDFSKLTPEQQKAYDDNVKPLLDQSDKLFEAINRLDPDRLGPKVKNHIYRIAKEHVGGDRIAQTNQSPDPVEGRVSAIGTNPTGTGLERQFYALERQDGHRFVISTAPEGFTIWNDGKGTRIKAPDFSFKEGDSYKVGPNTFKMDQATVKEIEAHGRFENGKRAQYYHNPMLSAVLANAELASIARHLEYLEALKHDPAFRQWAQPPHVDDNGTYVRPKGKEGWTDTSLPNFHDWKMDPQLAYTFDDYAAPGWNSRGLEAIQNIANVATKSIFLLPFAHINNVAAHWFVGRGWDWIKPTGYRNMVVDGMQAVKSVIKQDDLQRQLRDSGASTLYGGVLNRDFVQNIAKAVGQDIEKNPDRWGKVVKTLGMNKPSDLVSAMYQNSSKAMWMVNDMFLTQAVLEQQRKGLSMEGAINAVQKHIPAYRVPTQIAKPGPYGRLGSQTMQASMPFVFGRYHYAMWNSWANIVKDIVGNDQSKGAHRVEAIGQLMAAGALLFLYSYPLKKLAETITGNKEASFHPRGPATIPMNLLEARRTGDITGPLKSTFTTNPLFANVQETISNKDFGGRPIVEPGTAARALKGSPGAMAKAAGEEVEHGVRGFVAPYNTAADAYRAGRNPGQVVRDQVMDIKNPSAKAVKWIGQQPIQQNRQEQYRSRNPHGPLEALLDRFLK